MILFEWEETRRLPAARWWWILPAAIVHAGLFLFVEFRYPPPQDITPSRTPVWMPVEGTPEAERVYAWAYSRDPSLLSPTRLSTSQPAVQPPELYQPSFDTPRLALSPLPGDALSPAIRAPRLSFDKWWSPGSSRTSSDQPGPRTKLRFEGALAERSVLSAPETTFAAKVRQDLSPARFRVAADPGGDIAFVLLLEGSGNAQVDTAAAARLRQTKLTPGSELMWGDAVFLWGTDVERTR